MLAGETLFDAVSIVGDMEFGTCSESFGCCDTGVVVVPHFDGGEISVRAGSVPVTADRLRVKSSAHVELLSYSVEQPAGNPEMISGCRRTDGADLEFPLSRDDLSVDSRDGEAGFKAGVQVSFYDGSPKDFIGTDSAVIPSLRSGETVVRPT